LGAVVVVVVVGVVVVGLGVVVDVVVDVVVVEVLVVVVEVVARPVPPPPPPPFPPPSPSPPPANGVVAVVVVATIVVDVVVELADVVDVREVELVPTSDSIVVVDVGAASGGGESSTFMRTTMSKIKPTTTPAPTSTLDWVTCLTPWAAPARRVVDDDHL
jgi:hypothetical protein